MQHVSSGAASGSFSSAEISHVLWKRTHITSFTTARHLSLTSS